MSEDRYKRFRKFFVDLSDDDYLRMVAPRTKNDYDFLVNTLRKMKNFERKYGGPGEWLHKYGDYLNSPYKALVLYGEHSKEGFLYDRL